MQVNSLVQAIVDADDSGKFGFIPVEHLLAKAGEREGNNIFADDNVHHSLSTIRTNIDYLRDIVLT